MTPKDAARMEDGWLWVAVLDAFLLLMGLPAQFFVGLCDEAAPRAHSEREPKG